MFSTFRGRAAVAVARAGAAGAMTAGAAGTLRGTAGGSAMCGAVNGSAAGNAVGEGCTVAVEVGVGELAPSASNIGTSTVSVASG